MSKFVIEGGNRLDGAVRLQGAKNSALPILAATLIGSGESIIHNCPVLTDVDAAIRILQQLWLQNRDGKATWFGWTRRICPAMQFPTT